MNSAKLNPFEKVRFAGYIVVYGFEVFDSAGFPTGQFKILKPEKTVNWLV